MTAAFLGGRNFLTTEPIKFKIIKIWFENMSFLRVVIQLAGQLISRKNLSMDNRTNLCCSD